MHTIMLNKLTVTGKLSPCTLVVVQQLLLLQSDPVPGEVQVVGRLGHRVRRVARRHHRHPCGAREQTRLQSQEGQWAHTGRLRRSKLDIDKNNLQDVCRCALEMSVAFWPLQDESGTSLFTSDEKEIECQDVETLKWLQKKVEEAIQASRAF